MKWRSVGIVAAVTAIVAVVAACSLAYPLDSYAGACPPGYASCPGQSVSGCNVRVSDDNANCGACGSACGASSACAGGVCVCTTGFGDCDGLRANGCEARLADDPQHCGTCTTVCGDHSGCSGGNCGCAAGYGHCNGASTNACETDLSADARNCGACDSGCGGKAKCSFGACQAEDLETRHDVAVGIVVDAKNLYWVDYGVPQSSAAPTPGALFKAPKDTTSSISIAAGAFTHPVDLAWDAMQMQIYVIDQGSPATDAGAAVPGGLARVDLDGNNFTVIDPGIVPIAMAFDASTRTVYYSTDKQLSRIVLPPGPNTKESIPTTTPAIAIAARAGTVYWAESGDDTHSGRIARATPSGSGACAWTTGTGAPNGCGIDQSLPLSVAVDEAGTLYWGTLGDGCIFSKPQAATKADYLVCDLQVPAAIAVDKKTVYWVNDGTEEVNGSVASIGKDGQNQRRLAGLGRRPFPLATNLTPRIALDDTSVYFTEATPGGVVRRIAK